MPSVNVCPVCGYAGLEDRPYGATPTSGSYEICPACAYQFGVTDVDLGISHAEYRAGWIDRGMQWAGDDQPVDWDPKSNLRTLDADKSC